jgi:hypothetical protein
MKLLLYLNGSDQVGGRLQKAVEGVVATESIEICRGLSSLLQRIRQRKGDLSVVILCASSSEELTKILTFRHGFQDLRIILILPDRDNETLARALTLRPRFLSYVDTDFSDVSTVLTKMLKTYSPQFMEC